MATKTYTLRDVVEHVSYVTSDLLEQIDSIDAVIHSDPAVKVFVESVNAVLREINRFDGLRLQKRRYTFQTKAPEETGTVDLTLGSATVTGTGTAFEDADVGGAFSNFVHDGLYRVASVESPTSMTLDQGWAGTTVTGTTFRIAFDRYEAPSNLKEIRFASLAGDATWELDITPSEDIDRFRNSGMWHHDARTQIISKGRPKRIGIDPNLSDNNNFFFVVDIFPDAIMQVNLTVNLSIDRLQKDNDIIPLEDDNIDILFEGTEARWRTIQGGSPEDRQSWKVFIETRLPDFFSSDNRKTDRNARLIPSDTWRSVPVFGFGKPDWKNR